MAPKIQGTSSSTKSITLLQDVIDLLPQSTNKKPKGRVLFHGPIVKEGLIDKACFIKDIEVPYIGWQMFQHWFGNRNLGSPFSNLWDLNMGRLIVPNVYMDVDLLKDIASKYDLVSRAVRAYDGVVMVKITSEEIEKVFDLHERNSNMLPLDMDTIREEHNKTKVFISQKCFLYILQWLELGNNEGRFKLMTESSNLSQ